jgi:hypothetical protein
VQTRHVILLTVGVVLALLAVMMWMTFDVGVE